MTTPRDTISDPDFGLFGPLADTMLELQQSFSDLSEEQIDAFYQSPENIYTKKAIVEASAPKPTFYVKQRLRSEAVIYPDVKSFLDVAFPSYGVPTLSEDYKRWPDENLWSHDPLRGYFGFYVRRQAAVVASVSRRGFPQYLVMSHDSTLPDRVHNKIGGFYPVARTHGLPPNHAIIYYCGNNKNIDRPFHAAVNGDGTVSAVLRSEPLTTQKYGRRLIWE